MLVTKAFKAICRACCFVLVPLAQCIPLQLVLPSVEHPVQPGGSFKLPVRMYDTSRYKHDRRHCQVAMAIIAAEPLCRRPVSQILKTACSITVVVSSDCWVQGVHVGNRGFATSIKACTGATRLVCSAQHGMGPPQHPGNSVGPGCS